MTVFEVKINYPLPYPQIIQSVGESRSRILADSCEIEYVKKNGEVINDFDDDGEIQEKERLHFPVWQGPDYEENEVKPYYISNMIFTKEQCKPLDQTQFINKDSIFRVKIFDKSTRDSEKYFYLDNGSKEVRIKAFKTSDMNAFISDSFIAVSSKKGLEYDEKEKKYYKTINYKKIQAVIMAEGDDKEIKASIEGKENTADINEKTYAVWTLNRDLKAEYDRSEVDEETLTKFLRTSKTLSDIGYNAITELSPVSSEIQDVLIDNKKLKIFYFSGHGDYDEKNKKGLLYYYSNSPEDLSSYAMDNITISSTGAKVEFVFLNCCLAGKALTDDKGNYMKENYWSKAFKAESVAGWKIKSSVKESEDFAKDFFIKLKEDYPKNFTIDLLRHHFPKDSKHRDGFVMGDPDYTLKRKEEK